MTRVRKIAFSVAVFLSCLTATSAKFGYTDEDDVYTIDTGSDVTLQIGVSKSSCDLTSIRYDGKELQSSEMGSHIDSGLGSGTSVEIEEIAGSSNDYIQVTCTQSPITHYLVFASGSNSIYMATNLEEASGELRFIFRVDNGLLPEEYPFGNVSDISDTAGDKSTVEGEDVYLIDGVTHSKFYSSERYIDKEAHCVYGIDPEIFLCMFSPHQETSSGGPFFRDIESSNTDSYNTLYNYMYSGHVQTEDARTGLHGPYVATFSGSDIPTLDNIDTSFFNELNIEGYVPDDDRGQVTGSVSGIDDSYEKVVHWFNSGAQYWSRADSDGAFTSPYMKPGTYNMTLYQTEFKVAETTIEVSAGDTTEQDIASDFDWDYESIWKVGSYDGQPFEFRNGDKFLRMHPSDDRMESWTIDGFVIGESTADQFPMAVFADVNNPINATFTLASVPEADVTLRIATTLSFAGARPNVKVNDWDGDTPDAPEKIDSRGVTRGAYRGYGEIYEWTIPSSSLVEGENTLAISAESGSSGEGFLSPNVIFDVIDLFS